MSDNDQVIEAAAKAAHEENKAYCESIGDNSQPGWDEAEDWQRQSAINGVKFLIANPSAVPASLHENWRAEKTRDGWTYGPVKNVEDKLHPCMLPHDQLPDAQQFKDQLFFRTVTVFLGDLAATSAEVSTEDEKLLQTAEETLDAKVAE